MSEPKKITSGPFAGDTRASEPFMGVMKVSRCSGNAVLFDSDVEHMHFIEVEICEADTTRHSSNNWIHDGKQIVSVWMSEIQWAHFLSSMNQGGGSPVTLKHIMGRRIEPPQPAPPEADTFKAEIKETVQDSLSALKALLVKLTDATVPKAKTPNKGELNEMLALLQKALREFEANVPFVAEQFTEHVEAELAEAKTEFEGYMTGRLQEMGLKAAALAQASAEAPRPRFALPKKED
jgi:hypothetical protein